MCTENLRHILVETDRVAFRSVVGEPGPGRERVVGKRHAWKGVVAIRHVLDTCLAFPAAVRSRYLLISEPVVDAEIEPVHPGRRDRGVPTPPVHV